MPEQPGRTTTLNGLGPLSMTRHDTRIEARIAWLLDRMREREERREVSALLDALIARPRTPGARELAIVELAMHPDPTGRAALRVWSPDDAELDALRAACLGDPTG
jgi:hypothetical protein